MTERLQFAHRRPGVPPPETGPTAGSATRPPVVGRTLRYRRSVISGDVVAAVPDVVRADVLVAFFSCYRLRRVLHRTGGEGCSHPEPAADDLGTVHDLITLTRSAPRCDRRSTRRVLRTVSACRASSSRPPKFAPH